MGAIHPNDTRDGRPIQVGNRPDVRPDDAQTFQSNDKPWAIVSHAPFRRSKHYVHEAGISTPLIAHWPAGFKAQATGQAARHVVDILPTILEVTGRIGHALAGRGGATEAEMIRMYADGADKVGVVNWQIILPRLLEAWNPSRVDG